MSFLNVSKSMALVQNQSKYMSRFSYRNFLKSTKSFSLDISSITTSIGLRFKGLKRSLYGL